MSDDSHSLSRALGQRLAALGLTLTTAESCTGGGIAAAVTDIAGSSGWFDRGFVTYSNPAKTELLGVAGATLAAHGAASEPVVAEMLAGALARGRAQVAVAVSGIAGPSGGSADKPVGTVCFGFAVPGRRLTETCRFPGDRAAVRAASVRHTLQRLLELLAEGAGHG